MGPEEIFIEEKYITGMSSQALSLSKEKFDVKLGWYPNYARSVDL